MDRGFDRVVFIYDFLAKIVFGSAIGRAHTVFLRHFINKKQVLVLGGGSGKFLSNLYDVCPDAEVVFHEASPKMIVKARMNSPTRMNIRFDCNSNLDSLNGKKFDAVLSCFYWDLFEENNLRDRMRKLSDLVASDGRIILGDFEVTRHYSLRSILVRIMYLFFALTCGLKTKRLSPYWKLFGSHGYHSIASKRYVSSMIRVDVLEKAMCSL